MPATTVQPSTVTSDTPRPTATGRLLLVAAAATLGAAVADELLAAAARGLGVTLAPPPGSGRRHPADRPRAPRCSRPGRPSSPISVTSADGIFTRTHCQLQ